MSTKKLLLTIFGAVFALLGLGLLAGGGVVLIGYGTQRDADGFMTSPDYELTAGGHAITSEELTFGADVGDWFPEAGDFQFRVTVTPADPEQPIFLGIAPRVALEDYLAETSHSQITRFGIGDRVTYRTETGGSLPAAPTETGIWDASVEGTGTQTLTWDAQEGDWEFALLNADGSAGITATVEGGARIDLLIPMGFGLLLLGLLVAGIGVVMLVIGAVIRDSRQPEVASGEPAELGARPVEDRVYPVLIEAQLDPELSRWQWLVKWFLALPHLIVLAFLWAAFAVLTFAAGVAILFTGRYPRGIFDFNVGVLRWTWRVTYYAYGVAGTDKYPPFTLAPDSDYPTAFDVAYPEELSRGLVLVKWWLLAIPHYLVVGLFTGGLFSWTLNNNAGEGGWQVVSGGLIGLLVFIAVVALLFSGRYPRGLYDVVMGLQRWTYRVIAYAALMTDDYPPFRLDTGGTEPSPQPPSGPDEPSPDRHDRRESVGV